MLFTPPGMAHEEMFRGIDWFVFSADGRIKQIREFVYTNPGATGELTSFPYAEHGYPTPSDFDSRLPN